MCVMKIEESVEYSVFTVLNERKSTIENFLSDYPQLLEIVEGNLFVGKGYVSAVSQSAHHKIPTQLLLMIQRQHGYYENSAILLLQGQLDEALALLRMAAELSRDLLVLSKNVTLIPLWLNREKEYSKYRKKFKFDNRHAPNSYAQKLYKLTSKFGVHGHNTTLCHSDTFSHVSINNEKFVELSISNNGIASSLTIWFAAFFAIYANVSDCLKALEAHSEATLSLNQTLLNVCDGNRGVLKYLKEEYGIKFI